MVIYNASDAPGRLALPEGEWEILADGGDANCRKKAGEKAEVPAHSGMLLGRRVSVTEKQHETVTRRLL